jgi:hypothetical protein
MNILDFCRESSIEELQEIKKGIIELENIVLKKFVNAENGCDNLNIMLAALHDDCVDELDKGILSLAISCLCNTFNKELINKEIFRREMEDKEKIDE